MFVYMIMWLNLLIKIATVNVPDLSIANWQQSSPWWSSVIRTI